MIDNAEAIWNEGCGPLQRAARTGKLDASRYSGSALTAMVGMARRL